MDHTAIGRTVANLEIVELVGLGGAGEVYRALDHARNREVALKILSERAEPDMVLRFAREARALEMLRHPNIVAVYGAGIDQGLRYIAMELMRGPTLRERLMRSKLPWREAAMVARDITAALGHAHAHGVIHRDVKPGNVMFDAAGVAKLADFGLAHLSEASAMTRTGTVMGTVLYLSPEQAVGRPVDARSDLYALGAMLYEMLVGEPPFTGPSAVAIIYKHLNEQPARLRQIDATLPPALDALVERLLQKDPARRYQSAEELTDALERLLGGELEVAPGPELWPGESTAVAERGLLPLAGRQDELEALTAGLERAISGEGRTMLIAGEAGMGKTRLVHELARLAGERNVLVLPGACLYGDAPNPYAPYVEMVRAYEEQGAGWAGAPHDDEIALALDDVRSILGMGASADAEARHGWRQRAAPQDAQGQAFELISRLFAAVARRRPLVLAIDDLQWASPTTLHLFHYLARGLRGTRILLLGTYRPEDILPGAAGGRHPLRELLQRMGREHLYEQIALEAMSAEAVGALASEALNVPSLDVEFGELLQRESAGNPFFLLETLQLLQAQGSLERVEDHWELAAALEELEVPDGILDVVMRRVEQAEEDRELLDWAAVAGYDAQHRRIDAALLASLVGRPRLEVMRRLYALEQHHGLVVSGEVGFSFGNTKIREVLYDRMPAGLRRESHLSVGEVLEEQCAGRVEERVYELALHFCRGRHAEKGAQYALLAADRAEAAFAPVEAVAYLDDALSMSALQPATPERALERLHLEHRRGHLLATIGRLEEGIAALEAALQVSRDLGRGDGAIARIESELLLDLGAVHGRMGAWERAVALAAESLSLAEEIDDGERRASALLSTAFFDFERGDWESAVRRLRSALDIARDGGLELLQARILGNMAIMYNARGDRAQAIALYRGSIETFERLDQPLDVGRGLSNLGFSLHGLGHHEEAEACFRRALDILDRVGDVREQGVVYLHLAEAALAREMLDDARAHCTQAMRRFSRLGFELGMADVDRVYAGIARREGRWAVAERYLREALAVYEDYGDQLNLAETHEELGALLSEGGEEIKAAEELARSRTIYTALTGAPDPSAV